MKAERAKGIVNPNCLWIDVEDSAQNYMGLEDERKLQDIFLEGS